MTNNARRVQFKCKRMHFGCKAITNTIELYSARPAQCCKTSTAQVQRSAFRVQTSTHRTRIILALQYWACLGEYKSTYICTRLAFELYSSYSIAHTSPNTSRLYFYLYSLCTRHVLVCTLNALKLNQNNKFKLSACSEV